MPAMPANPRDLYLENGEIDERYTRSVPCPSCGTDDLVKQRRLASLREHANLPAPPTGVERWSFDTYEVNRYPAQMNARATVEAWALGGAELPWVVLHGPRGTGKSHLCAAAGEAAITRGVSARYEYVDDLVRFLRAHQLDGEGDSLLEQLRAVEYLVLDDLGAQTMSEWAQGQVLALIDYRYRAKTPLLVTTNKPLDELEARTEDRLQDVRVSQVIPMQWDSYRPLRLVK